MSAPNGNALLTNRPRENGQMVRSGKTDYKRGRIEHVGKEAEKDRIKRGMSRARREEQEDDGGVFFTK